MIVVKRPPSNPNVGSLVGQIEKRIPFMVNRGSGYSNPDYRWRWCCPVCTFTCEGKEQADVQREADAHKCGAGWCAVPITAERAALLGARMFEERPGAERVVSIDGTPRRLTGLLPTKADRERWNELRERNRRGRA